MSDNPFAKYSAPQQAASGNPFAKYAQPDQGQDEIVNQYANEILRRNEIYRTIPQQQLADPDRLRKLAELEAQRNGYKPIQPIAKQGKAASFAMGYGQGGSFGFGDEISGAADFVGGTAMGLARGEGMGAIDSGKQAYSDRVEADRRIQRQAAIDNPVSNLIGNLVGGVVTTAPLPASWVGAGARTTAQVSSQAALKANKLQALSQTGAKFLQANRASRATNLSAKAAALSRPAANFGEEAARFGGRVAEATGKGFGYGAAYGGAYGLGTAEGNLGERLDDAAQGAAFGGVGGAVLSPAMQFVVAPIVGKAGYSLFTSLDNKALDKVLQRAERSGTSLTKVRADFDAWAKTGEVPETLAELMGPHERSLLSAMITVNRETEERAGSILLGRGKKEVDRLEKSFARAMGAERGDFAGARAGAQKARREDPAPLYDAAHYGQGGTLKPLDPNKQAALNNILIDEDDVVTILKDAKADLNRSGNKGARDEVVRYMEAVQDLRSGKPAQLPNLSVQAADYIERAINDAFKAAGAGTGKVSGGVRGWGMLRDNVRSIIDDTGVGAARATAAERIRRGELLDEGRNFLDKNVDIEDITDTLRGNPALGIAPASPAGQQAYTVGAARAIGDTLRDTQDMKGFADATRKVARTPAIREKVSAVLPQGKLTKKGVPNKGSRQTKLNQQLERDIERTADRADFTNTMLGNSRTAFRQGAVDDALADDQLSTAIGDGVRDLLIGGVGNVAQQALGKFAKGAGARLGQPGIMRPGLNRKMADILLATDAQIPVQIQRLAARAAQKASGRARIRPTGAAPAGQFPPPGGGPKPPKAVPLAATVGAPTPSPQGGQKGGKLGTRAADAAAIATLGLQGGTAEADTGGVSAELKTANERVVGIEAQISKLDNETIPTLEEQIRLLQDYKADPKEKQRILIARGHDLGTFGPNKDGVDGDLRPGSYSAKAVISEVAKIEADIARRRKEREAYTGELATARGEVNKIKVSEAEEGGKPATPLRDKVLEFGSYGAGIYLAHRFRNAGLNAAQKNATAIESKANALLSRRPPVPPVPDRTALGGIPLVGQPIEKALFPNKVARNTSATNAAVRAAQAAEPRLSGNAVPPISPNPTSPDGLTTRVANLNKYYLDGGAERQLPVEDLGNGQFAMRSDVMPDHRLYGPKGPIGRFAEPLTSRFRTGDVAVTAGGAVDYTVMSGMVEQTRADIKTAEEELTAARAANGGLGDATRINVAKKDIEKLETIESVQVGFQRLGLGIMGFGLLGGMHGKYARPQPRHEAAIRERNLIAQAISPIPTAPPPAPVVPPPSATVNAFASPPPKKPRTVGKPKPKPPVSFNGGRSRKAENDNDR